MTSAQCACDMQPLDTSSFKEELLSDADATPARHPDASGGSGNMSGSTWAGEVTS